MTLEKQTQTRFRYRKYYEESVGTKIDKDYEIHHLDFNRHNNYIINLVALPKYLHRKYHNTLASANRNFAHLTLYNDIYSEVCSWGVPASVGYQRWLLNRIHEEINVIEECEREIVKYINIRNNLIQTSND